MIYWLEMLRSIHDRQDNVRNFYLSVDHGDGEIDTFLSLLMMLNPTAESLDSCLIPAPFCKTGMRILSLFCLGRDEILSMGIPWHSSNNISVTSKSDGVSTFSREEQSSTRIWNTWCCSNAHKILPKAWQHLKVLSPSLRAWHGRCRYYYVFLPFLP